MNFLNFSRIINTCILDIILKILAFLIHLCENPELQNRKVEKGDN